MSAQEAHIHDDEEKRQHPGGNPGDPGATPAANTDDKSDDESARLPEEDLLEEDADTAR